MFKPYSIKLFFIIIIIIIILNHYRWTSISKVDFSFGRWVFTLRNS